MEVCEDCCQYKSFLTKCKCEGGGISSKHLGLVNGCVIYKKQKRCKKQVTSNFVCKEHNRINIESDKKFIEKLFG